MRLAFHAALARPNVVCEGEEQPNRTNEEEEEEKNAEQGKHINWFDIHDEDDWRRASPHKSKCVRKRLCMLDWFELEAYNFNYVYNREKNQNQYNQMEYRKRKHTANESEEEEE